MSISYKRGLVSYLKKYDYFLFSVLLASLLFLIEALVHWVIFPGEHTLKGAQRNLSFWNEFLYPSPHELYTRILFMGFIIFFGLIYQININRKRFSLTHDPFTNARVFKYEVQFPFEQPT